MPDAVVSTHPSVDFRIFWGKARPSPDQVLTTHPAAWHGLDVAASFQALWHLWRHHAAAIAGAFDGRADDVLAGLSSLAALHDIGKFAPTFQAKVQDVYPLCLGVWSAPPKADHGAIGYALAEAEDQLAPIVRSMLGDHNDLRRAAILGPVFGHHGRPIEPEMVLRRHIRASEEPAAVAARDFARAAVALFGAPCLPPLLKGHDIALSWRLAGLIALADWIGSDQRYFRYEESGIEPAAYWTDYARPRARAAVAASGLAPSGVSMRLSLDIVGGSGFKPTAAQNWAQSVPLEIENGLFILEDVMGSGKTEAALILAHRLMQAGRADGLYVALPTMATANALYRRMAAIYRLLFADGTRPSLVLAHGARDLDPHFRDSIGPAAQYHEAAFYGDDPTDETGSAACTRWLSDDRRKTFLADIGVGTIDQALLAVLPVKHACIRQVGLARRVLVLDEAHAYDAYMQREIETLIMHQARLGAPVIVLSATLPRLIKERLAAAFAKGRGLVAPPLSAAAYPLVTAIGSGVEETAVAVREGLARDIAVTRCPDSEAAEQRIVEAAAQGAAVAYIRNSVDDAIASYERLLAAGLDVSLFHARFAMQDRIAIEDRVVGLFGKYGTRSQRKGAVLVATQVVEQSLDLDFDLLVTDLAPVDLMIQRSGRLWRHQREGRGSLRPELIVVSPAPAADAGKDWYAEAFPHGQWVYRNHALLWLSAREIFASDRLRVPDDLRRLVDAVYCDEMLDLVPEPLQASGMEAAGKDIGSRGHASLNLLKLEKGCSPRAWG